MKKKILGLFSIFAIAILMSGCVKYNANIKITSDKKMTMELIIATSKSMQGMMEGAEEQEDNEEIQKLKEAGWTVESYEDSEYKGQKLKKTYSNIDELTADSETNYDLNELVQEGKEAKYMFYKEAGSDVYKAKFKANTNMDDSGDVDVENMTPEEKAEYEQTQEMAKQMLSSTDLKLTVEVPKVVSSNATTTDGNKLTWDLTKLENVSAIEFQFELKGGSSFPIVPVVIGGCVLLIAVVAVILISKKKKTTPAA